MERPARLSPPQDNVFVNIDVAVQFRVMLEKVYEAFYRRQNIHGQINASAPGAPLPRSRTRENRNFS